MSKRLLNGAERLDLLDKLQEKGLVPLIRSTRLSCYDLALLEPRHIREMERVISSWTEAEGDAASYCNGDVFCFEDFALFLIFEDAAAANEQCGIRAGIVYEADTFEPQQRLDAFCQDITQTLLWQTNTSPAALGNSVENGGTETVKWYARDIALNENTRAAFARFAAEEGREAGIHEKDQGTRPAPPNFEMERALEHLSDTEARRALRRIRDKHADGNIEELLVTRGTNDWVPAQTIEGLLEAGLLRNEVLISCRRKERALFRLPSPEALAFVTSSNAICSECGTSLADEKVEEVIAPTELAHTLLEDGAWLAMRLRAALREEGVADEDISAGVYEGEGESYMLANVCHELFLFALREGDLTSTFARRALDRQLETVAAHLLIITTGKIHEDGRARLRDGVRRRAQEGEAFELISVEGMERAATELHHAFDRASRKQVINELYALDRNLGLSAGHLLATRFHLRQKSVVSRDLKTSAGGVLAGNLREP